MVTESYKSDMHPNIVVLGPKWREPYFLDGFVPFANVFYIQEDLFSNLLGAFKRSLLFSRLEKLPSILKKLAVKLTLVDAKIKEYSKWRWQVKYLERTGIDGIVVIPPALPPKRIDKRFGDPKIFLLTGDVEVKRFFEGYLWLARLNLVDKLYVSHPILVNKFVRAGVSINVDVLPYYFSPSLFNPYPIVEREFAPVFIGTLTRGREIFVRYLYNSLKTKHNISLQIFQAANRDYSFLAKRKFINIDIPRKREVNFRVFEVTGSGGLLITGSHPLVTEFYNTDGVEIYSYIMPSLNDVALKGEQYYKEQLEQAANIISDIIGYILENREEAEKTAYRGCVRAWKEHTIHHRACKLVNDLGFKCDTNYLSAIERWGQEACKKLLLERND